MGNDNNANMDEWNPIEIEITEDRLEIQNPTKVKSNFHVRRFISYPKIII